MCMGPDGDGAKRIITLPIFAFLRGLSPCLVFRLPISCCRFWNCSDCCSFDSWFTSFIVLFICWM